MLPHFPAVSGVVLGAIVFVLVAGAGLIVGATVGVRTPSKLALAAYVIGFAEIVGLCLFLSLFGAITRSALVIGSAAVFAAMLGVWLLAEAPRPPVPALSLHSLARVRSLVVLAAVVALALSYVVALILGTPPNGWDQLNYHLARAALWLQAGRVAYVENAYDARIDSYPPNGEIALAFVLGVTHDEVFAGVVQLAAALACAVGVFALARQLCLRRREAAFGALLFLTLPIVLLQASSTKNDLVVASFLVAASVFVLGNSRHELFLVSLATALAVGTKFSASYGVVVLLALVLGAAPRSLRTLRLVAIAAGAAVGLYWYAVNTIETGRVLGDTSNIPGLTAPLSPRENLLEAFGLAVDAVDLSGASGTDILFYVFAAFVVATGLAFLGMRSSVNRRQSAVAGAALVASPLAFYVLANEVGRPVLLKLYDILGEPKAYIPGDSDPNSSPTLASDTGSWYGPVGLLLVVGIAIATVIVARRGSFPRSVLVPAAAPLIWFVLVALSLTYHPWQGRFFVFPIAISASLWGLVLRRPVVAWAMTTLAAVTAVLSLVHYAEKPSGLRLLDRSPTVSVWEMERWQVQSSHDPAVASVFRYLDEEMPRRAAVGLAFGANDFGYPVFGPRLERRVELVPFGSNGAEIDADWLVANPERAAEIDDTCWRKMHESEGGTVFRRVPGACSVRSSAAP